MAKGFEVEFATGGSASSFLSSFGYRVHNVVRAPVPLESKGKLIFSTLWYLRYWYGYQSTISRMLRLVEVARPDFVVGDEEFTSVSIAMRKKLKHAMITDERELAFARGFIASVVEERVKRWYAELQKKVSCLIIPDFGHNEGNVHFVTPVVREVTMSRDDVLSRYDLPQNRRIVIFSMSGSRIGGYIAEKAIWAYKRARLEDTILVITGEESTKPPDGSVYHLGFLRDNQNLVAASDLVISLAGKSTIDEALSNGVPMIAIPLKNHFEQEKNARNLGFSHDDINHLDSLIIERIGKFSEPRRYSGATIAADLLASLISR